VSRDDHGPGGVPGPRRPQGGRRSQHPGDRSGRRGVVVFGAVVIAPGAGPVHRVRPAPARTGSEVQEASRMKKQLEDKFRIFVQDNKHRIFQNPFFKPGEGRAPEEKEENYRLVLSYFAECSINSVDEKDVRAAAKIIKDVSGGRTVEVEKPPKDP